MTNRLKLLNTNMYDLLIKMNNQIKQKDDILCVLNIIESHPVECPADKTCEECIQHYLNQEI